MVTKDFVRHAELASSDPRSVTGDVELVQAAETILRRYGPRAITILTNPRVLEDGRRLPARLSANDCYVAMADACRKMARVSLRKYRADAELQALGFAAALDTLFPDPPAYLTRCLRSVVSDAERAARRDVPTISMDQPLSGAEEGHALCLRDTLPATDAETQPEEALIAQEDRIRFRRALAGALQAIPKNYLEALHRDIARERERQNGSKLAPESDKERQTVCRARAALSQILRRECGLDNPFVRLLAQQRSSRVRQKSSPSPNWTRERQDDLFRRLLNAPWSERAAVSEHPEDNVEEAIVNEVSSAKNVAPPSPEMRQAMRVMDAYVLGDNPTAETTEAQALYKQAQQARYAGRLDEAIRLYRAAYELEPDFFAAYNEVGVLLIQQGNLRDALKVFLAIIENPRSGDHKYIAATNAADIYLTWFDAGRNKERNIERATHFARLAMEKPTPMRACNLLLAFVKDRYYVEAQRVMDTVMRANLPQCPAEKFLQTLFQIRDADLVTWWNWLDGELGKDTDQ
ncbi:MAG TPA: tetratricopeptide repeat protein [Chthonomonadaceae bacterium]|nr:tetratricopeptide repeat protein [Chthonomonadaceae bacterium]